MIWLNMLAGVFTSALCFWCGFTVGETEGKARVRRTDGEKIWQWLFQKRQEAPLVSGEEEAFKEAHEMIERWQLTGKVT